MSAAKSNEMSFSVSVHLKFKVCSSFLLLFTVLVFAKTIVQPHSRSENNCLPVEHESQLVG